MVKCDIWMAYWQKKGNKKLKQPQINLTVTP